MCTEPVKCVEDVRRTREIRGRHCGRRENPAVKRGRRIFNLKGREQLFSYIPRTSSTFHWGILTSSTSVFHTSSNVFHEIHWNSLRPTIHAARQTDRRAASRHMSRSGDDERQAKRKGTSSSSLRSSSSSSSSSYPFFFIVHHHHHHRHLSSSSTDILDKLSARHCAFSSNVPLAKWKPAGSGNKI